MISAISPSTTAPPRSTSAIGDAADDRVRREARGVVRAAALHRQHQRRRRAPARARRGRSRRPARARSRSPRAVARTVPPSPWIDTMLRRLAGLRARVGEVLRDHLLAPERDDDHRADVRDAARRRASVSCVTLRSGRSGRSPPGAAAPRRSARSPRRSARRPPPRRSPSARRARDCGRRRRPSGARVAEERPIPARSFSRLGDARLAPSRGDARSPRAARARDVVGVDVRAGGDVRRGRADRAAVFDDALARARIARSATLCPRGIASVDRHRRCRRCDRLTALERARAPSRRCRRR